MSKTHTQLRWLTALAAVAMSALFMSTSVTAADTWNERTVLTFTEPVMVPGATLQPGTYTFKLADIEGSRHMVQVLRGEGDEMVATTQAVPVRRDQATGDTILTFNPTDRGIPALKAWYYPHSSYGHEFIYPEQEARHIAERSKTIVLSMDVNDSDLSKGTLRLYHPGGNRTEWRGDADIENEWKSWQEQRTTSNRPATAARTEQHADHESGDADRDDTSRKSSAPMMITDAPGMSVQIDELESNPTKYLGRTITVDAEVEEVYGPRLFTIDEPHWGDLDGEVLVYTPSLLAALVKDDDRVTITGTVQNVAIAEISREWGWFELDPAIEVDFLKKPVLLADRIVGGDNDVALFLKTAPTSDDPTPVDGNGAEGDGRDNGPSEGNADNTADTSALRGSTVIMDAAMVGSGTTDLVGRQVDLKNVRVLRMAADHGFFIDLPGGAVLVLPTGDVPVTVKPGDTVSVQGAIGDVPRRTAERVNPPSNWNRHIYLFATVVTK